MHRLPITAIQSSLGEPDVVTDVGPDARKVTLTGLRPSTSYDVIVQPYNQIGLGRPSPSAHVTTKEGKTIRSTLVHLQYLLV